MKQIFDDSEQRYGAEKIHTVLAANGIRTSRRRIAVIMQELGLHSVRTDAKKQHKRKQQLKKGKPAETRISGKPSKSDMGQRYYTYLQSLVQWRCYCCRRRGTPFQTALRNSPDRRSRPPAGCSIVSPDSSGSGYPVQISGG